MTHITTALGAAMPARLRLALRTENGLVVGVVLSGAADAYAERDLRAVIVFAEVYPGLVIDLSAVTSIDDVGLDHLKRVAELGSRFQRLSKAVRFLLEERGEPDALPFPDGEAF